MGGFFLFVEISFVLTDNLSMIKTYDIDLDDELVECASDIFDNLGTDIDSAIKIFLKQVVLRKGFPFEIVIPEETESGKLKAESSVENAACESENPSIEEDDIHGGITEEEENAAGVAVDAPVFRVSPEIAARVAANEALVAEMRNEIGEKEVTPEFEENEDDGTYGNYEQSKIVPEAESSETEDENLKTENETADVSTKASDDENAAETGETSSYDVPEKSTADEDDSEDEDESTPDNLFDAWDVGEEEETGCR